MAEYKIYFKESVEAVTVVDKVGIIRPGLSVVAFPNP